MQNTPKVNQSVAGEIVAYDKSSGIVQINLNIGRNRPVDQIPSCLNLTLDGNHINIVVKTQPATAANSTNHDTRFVDKK